MSLLAMVIQKMQAFSLDALFRSPDRFVQDGRNQFFVRNTGPKKGAKLTDQPAKNGLWQALRQRRSSGGRYTLQSLLQLVFDNSLNGMMVTSAKGSMLLCNQELLRLFALQGSALKGDAPDWLSKLAPQVKEPQRLRSFVEQILVLPVGETLDIFELTNGRLLECHTTLLDDPQSRTIFRMWTFVDCTEQQRRERELHHLSMHDTLTNVYNRSFFEIKLNQFRLHKRYPISMVMFDVDGLKKVNDAYGHSAGDELLRQAAMILRQACRSEDIVARLGGDEFGLLLANADSETTEQVIYRLERLLSLYNMRHSDSPVSLSFGSAVAHTAEELDNLVARADDVMYRERRKRRQSN